MQQNTVREAINAYVFPGVFEGADNYGCGHINDTYAVKVRKSDGSSGKYLLQRLNTFVFKRPEHVMKNVRAVTSHLREKISQLGGNPERETLNLISTKSGGDYYLDSTGHCWRCYRFIDNTVTLQIAETPQHMYEAAKVFGRFQRLLSDYPVEQLYETIPNFHHTPMRYQAFLKALEADPLNRADTVKDEASFIMERAEELDLLVSLEATGVIPLRVTHNDTKLNNVLLDAETEKGLCATDLDTVMPGNCLYDYGDAIRSGTNPAAEDEQDLSKVYMDETLFEAYTRGYLEEAGCCLTEKEIELMPASVKIISLELGMRFLTDYLEGDVYFKIHRDGQNLDRSRTQLKMALDVEQKWDTMKSIIGKYI